MLCILEFLEFSETRSNKGYVIFIPLNSSPKKHHDIGFRKFLAVVSKFIRNIASKNTTKNISLEGFLWYLWGYSGKINVSIYIYKWNVDFTYGLIWRLSQVVLPSEFLHFFLCSRLSVD